LPSARQQRQFPPKSLLEAGQQRLARYKRPARARRRKLGAQQVILAGIVDVLGTAHGSFHTALWQKVSVY
jgi:hypothetical protein